MNMAQRIEVAGQQFVLIPESDYQRLCAQAGEPLATTEYRLPPLPLADSHGRFPAIEYARVSLARDVIRDRRAAGLTQTELAKLAGTRQETISRIESGKYSASVKLIDKIDRVLQAKIKARARRAGKRKATKGRGN
jgi:DNA-binding XRE family transcriptional regulator